MNTHDDLRALLIQNEGRVEHMYLDTVGNVTVGVGHLLASVERAQLLPFNNRSTGAPWSSSEVSDEWNTIKAQKPAMVASYYRQFTSLDMESADIDNLLSSDIAEMEAGVSNNFAGYGDYPNSPQDALLDMAFNLGVGGLAKYKRLHAAAEAKDWGTCATECHRKGIPDARNQRTAELFRAGVGTPSFS